ncbi:hypothetical protein DYB28_000771 [Aphanomyces astaci]|uniref:Uncharacterized protein n=1 Tax=Aphanomyces astaci TaxID=112090 RepID=A0A9X8DM18_APHAT|nr:hypothetical protein DYB28_000771 [Aphanomyces astaci]
MKVQQLVPPDAISLHHASRLRMYCEGGLEVDKDLKAQIAFGDEGFYVDAIQGLRMHDAVWQLKIKWYGLDDLESSQEPAISIYEDVPVLFRRWIKDRMNEGGVSEMAEDIEHAYGHPLTIDVAKSTFVAYFKSKRVSPNPAQDSISRQYIVGLQKFNKKNNVDEEKKAHPLTVHELSTLMNGLSGLHPFVGSLIRLLLPVAFLGCYRISEVLNLRRNDVQLVSDGSGRYLSVRLRWHKKANVEEYCQIYHFIDETSYPCLRVCTFHDEYLATLRASSSNVASSTFVFPNFTIQQGGVPRVDWHRAMEQSTLRKLICKIVNATPNLPIARSGLQTWQHWFVADPGAILICALKDYNSDMIHLDRMKYSERFTLASAFEKYQSYE